MCVCFMEIVKIKIGHGQLQEKKIWLEQVDWEIEQIEIELNGIIGFGLKVENIFYSKLSAFASP